MAKPAIVPRFASSDLLDPTTSENNVQEPSSQAKDYGWIPAFIEPFRGWMNWLHRYYYLWLNYIDTELEPQVTTNTGNIATNTSNIATNAADILTNSGLISTNTGNIASNAADILTNANNHQALLDLLQFDEPAGVFNVKVTNAYLNIEAWTNLKWWRFDYIIFIAINELHEVCHATNTLLEMEPRTPETQWPIELLGITGARSKCIVQVGGTTSPATNQPFFTGLVVPPIAQSPATSSGRFKFHSPNLTSFANWAANGIYPNQWPGDGTTVVGWPAQVFTYLASNAIP